MDLSKFTFRQIEADPEIKSFDCGDAVLNDFFVSDVKHLINETQVTAPMVVERNALHHYGKSSP